MPMYSACGNAALPALGFPIRESAGHRLFSASPRLIAAVHALHRLLVPRHPPCALPILTVITRSARKGRTRGDTRSRPSEGALRWHGCAVFKVRAGGAPSGTPRVVSQNSTAWPRGEPRDPGPVDVRDRLELDAREMRTWHEAGAPVLELP